MTRQINLGHCLQRLKVQFDDLHSRTAGWVEAPSLNRFLTEK